MLPFFFSVQILSIMLYSSKKEISSLVEREDTELEERDQDQDVDQSFGPTDLEQNKLDPLEGLDEATKICFLVLFSLPISLFCQAIVA